MLGVVVALDQLTKAIVRGAVSPGERDGVFPGIELVRVRNNGVAFGLFDDGGAILAVLTGGALLLLLGYFALNASRPLVWLPTGLLLGGAIGNLIDRARDGAVTDFIDIPLWPAFNLADMAITAGIFALLLAIEAPRRDESASA